MKTHNFYADLVLSLRTFFDKLVFPNGIIKGYRFNIGNRSLQLKYDTKFELPWMNIDYQDGHPISYFPDTWLKTQAENISKYQVLYNETKNLSLVLREELHEFQIQVTINCESQLSAISIKHDIEGYLVHNRYFQLYSFISFFEIDDKLLHEDVFDVNNDRIYNLFMQYEPYQDKTVYSFSVKYEPLIRLESADLSIGSTEQRSFPITLSLNIINPLPIYYEIPNYERGNRNIEKELCQHDLIIPISSNYTMLTLRLTTIENKSYNIPAIIYTPTGDFLVNIDYDNDIRFVGNISGNFNKQKSLGVFKTVINDFNYEVQFEQLKSDNVNTIIRLFGSVSGVIVKVKDESQSGLDYISGWFNGFVNGKPVQQRIEGELIIDSICTILNDSKLFIDTCNDIIANYDIYPQPIGLLSYNITDFNSKLLRFDLGKTRVTEIIFFYNTKVYSFPVIINIDLAGNFKYTFNYTIDSLAISGHLLGKLNSLKYTLNIDYNINDPYVQLVGLKFDFGFKSSVGYGAPLVNKININFTDNASPISSALGTLSYFKDEFIEIENFKNKLLLQNVILNSEFKDDFFIDIDNSTDKLIKVVLSEGFNVDDLILNSKFYWRFYLNLDRDIIDGNTTGIIIETRTNTTPTNIIYFRCKLELFDAYFYSKIRIDNPIFFQLYKIY